MEATLENGKIALRFSYSERIIEQLRVIGGRRWVPLMKTWEIPLTDKNVILVEEIGFNIDQLKSDIKAKKNEKETHFSLLEKELELQYPFLYKHQIECTAKAIVSKRLLIADETGCGKCVIPETNIYLDDGIMSIYDIWENHRDKNTETKKDDGMWWNTNKDLYVYSLGENKKIEKKKIKKIYREQINTKIDKVTLKDGSILYKTKKHRLLNEKFEWINKPEIFVCLPSKLPEGERNLDNDIVKLLAWQIAEGNEINTNKEERTHITQKEPKILYELEKIVKKIGIKVTTSISIDKRDGVHCLNIYGKDYHSFLYYNYDYKTFGNNSRDKVIPKSIMGSNNENLKTFLTGFFDGEAHVSERNIEISSASKTIIEQLSFMLRKFGIWLRIEETEKYASNTEKKIKRKYWRGFVSGNSMRIFLKEIGFSIDYKQKQLIENCKKKENTNVDRIYIKDVIDYLYDNKMMTQRTFGLEGGYCYKESYKHPSRKKTKEVIELMEKKYDKQRTLFGESKTTKLIKNIKGRLNAEVFYCDIDNIEEVDYIGYVYDLEIEDTHNYMANGIISHNTVEALATADYLLKKTQIERIVVLCPKSIMKQWKKEADKFFSLRFSIIMNMPKNKRLKAYEKQKHLVMTYDTAAIDMTHLYNTFNGKTMLIMDEMTKVKNEKTRRSKSIQKFRPEYMLGLTGTPIETKLKDGFVIGTTLFPDWMNKNEFYNEYCIMEHNGYGNMLVGYRNITGFMQRLMEISIARKKKDVRADMPDKLYYIRNIEQTPQQKAISKEIMFIIRKKKDTTREIYLEDCVLLHMCGNSTSLIKDSNALALKKMDKDKIKRESGKIKELVELLREIGNKKIVIFAHYLGMVKEIKDALKDTVMSATSENVVEQIENFKTNDKRVLLLTDSCAYGVDIPFATALIHFDIQWNHAKMKQREERIYRITSEHDISIYYFVSDGVEDYMFNYMKSKEEIGEQVTGMDIKKQLQKFLYR